MAFYLGIDGGGTKTVAAVSDENGKVVLKSEGKTINFYSVGMEKARENLSSLVKEICGNLKISCFDGAFVGCSALDGEADEETLNALCGGIINAKRLSMNSDVFVALKASGDESCRAVAVCGTGSMAIGTNGEKTVIKGGWGHLFGDEGSAYSIAVNGLRACAILHDEGKNNPLLKAAEEFFGVDDLRNAISEIYSPQITKDVLSKFAVKVGECAESDVIAKTIILNEAHSLARTVLFLLEELKNCEKLSLYGGVFKNNVIFRECFINDINEIYKDLKIELLSVPAEEGALKAAQLL